MHVEALQWSGLTAGEYARIFGLSVHSLRHWRKEMTDDPPGFDWRELVHPSARPRPKLSTSVSDSAKEPPIEGGLTAAPAAGPEAPERPRRRSFSAEEKLAIVLETERPGATVSQVARTHRIVTSVLFRWRAELGFGRGERANLAEVRIADRPRRGRLARSEMLILGDLLPAPIGTEAVELADGRRVFVPVGSDPEAVRRYVAEQESER